VDDTARAETAAVTAGPGKRNTHFFHGTGAKGTYHLTLFHSKIIYIWLVVSTPLKDMSSSVGMIIPNIWENNPAMFQTTNQ
jgi:hypothetical protein